jgi:hypothetical protein
MRNTASKIEATNALKPSLMPCLTSTRGGIQMGGPLGRRQNETGLFDLDWSAFPTPLDPEKTQSPTDLHG